MSSIDLLNNILAQTTRYGAQVGGFYATNIKEEREVIESWLEYFDLIDSYEVVFEDFTFSDGHLMYGVPQVKIKL